MTRQFVLMLTAAAGCVTLGAGMNAASANEASSRALYARADIAPPSIQVPQYVPAGEARHPRRPQFEQHARHQGAYQSQHPGQMGGGGFLEFLFNDGGAASRAPGYRQQMPEQESTPQYQHPRARRHAPAVSYGAPAQPAVDPRFETQVVTYQGRETPGTIVIDTPSKFLYLVQGDGTAVRYGIGVGRPGFTWSGVKRVSAKREWPGWTPPAAMLKRRPDLPRYMEGGPDNPLGARALYLGSSLYRIHGSNEPWTIGTNVSSGGIRMRNEDVIDLYERVKVGTRVVVL